MKSILQVENECYLCREDLDECNIHNLHKHHVFQGFGRRPLSEKYGLHMQLCANHHNFTDAGPHFNKEVDIKLKQNAQKIFTEHFPNLSFIKVFGKNYI